MKTLYLFVALAAACLGVSSAAAAAEATPAPRDREDAATYELKYRFAPGETIQWGVEHRYLIDTTVSGTSEVSEGRTRSVKSWVVEEIDADGVATLAHRVDQARLRQQTGDRPAVEYDSRGDQPLPPEFIQMDGMIGPVLTRIRVDSSGAVLQREDLLRGAQAASDSDALLIPLPTGPIRVGEAWTLPRDVQVSGEDGATRQVRVRRRYKLTAVDGRRATIRIETHVLSPVRSPAVIAQLVQELGDGEATFDLDRGKLVHRQLDLNKEVVAFSGPASVMRYEGRFIEKLLTGRDRLAARR